MKILSLLFLGLSLFSLENLDAKNIKNKEEMSAYKKELMGRSPGLTSKSVQKRLTRANLLMAKGGYDKSIAILTGMLEGNRRSFEKAKVWQTLAYAYAQSEKYPQAKKAFNKVIELDALPYKPTLQSVFALAQLQMMDSNYDGALKNMNLWFGLANQISPEAYVFLGSIHYEKGNKDKALELVVKAINLVKKPKENWLVFAVSILYSKEKYEQAAQYLYQLVELKPAKKSYWSQLAGSLLNQDKNKHALSVLELALMMNLLDQEGEILNIVSLYLQNGLPFEASTLLEKGFKKKFIKRNAKNVELYANSLVQAKEYSKAMKPLDEAAGMAKDGRLYALQGRLFLEKENFDKAIKSFDKAIKKGVKKKEEGQILVESAIAYIQMHKYTEADKLLNKALSFKDVSKSVNNWKNYLASLQ